MKLTKYLTSFLFSFVALIGFYRCNNRELPTHFEPLIADYIHLKGVANPTFAQADTYKYDQDYRKAYSTFQSLLPKLKAAEDKNYAYNQLSFIALQMNEDSLAKPWIDSLAYQNTPLSKSALADYQYNVGVWAYHTFKPKMAEAYLQKALGLYQDVYGEQHLKVGLCLTQFGMVSWDFSTNLDSIFSYFDRSNTFFKSTPLLKDFSKENELGMAIVSLAKRSHDAGLTHCELAIKLATTRPFQDSIFIARCYSMKGNMLKKKAQNEEKAELYLEAEKAYKSSFYYVKHIPVGGRRYIF